MEALTALQYYPAFPEAVGDYQAVIATSNAAICIINTGEDIQPSRYDCEDMTSVDHIIDDTYQMERYIDARHGGPGRVRTRLGQKLECDGTSLAAFFFRPGSLWLAP